VELYYLVTQASAESIDVAAWHIWKIWTNNSTWWLWDPKAVEGISAEMLEI